MKKIDPLKEHKKKNGKLEVRSTVSIQNMRDLAVWYTPGVGDVATYLGKHPEKARDYTIKRNTVAIVSDGSSVLGLGNIGPYGALPVMEGKAAIFKEFADIDAFPIVLDTQDPGEIVQAVAHIAPAFGGINLEDIAAPHCFDVETRLKAMLDIPVFHDDQHGTAIVVLAGLLNAVKVTKKKFGELSVVILGAGAAGTAIANLLSLAGVGKIRVLDSRGVVSSDRSDLNPWKEKLARATKAKKFETLETAISGADVFVGVARAGLLKPRHIKSMAPYPIVFALSNPIPEILPELALRAGAGVVATGRSDFPNQINNALAFPGIFRGALDNRVRQITDTMKLRAAHALASVVSRPRADRIIPPIFDTRLVRLIAKTIR
jgi:malate dehydrogenase (oxaloacetate-decarboxylating)